MKHYRVKQQNNFSSRDTYMVQERCMLLFWRDVVDFMTYAKAKKYCKSKENIRNKQWRAGI